MANFQLKTIMFMLGAASLAYLPLTLDDLVLFLILNAL